MKRIWVKRTRGLEFSDPDFVGGGQAKAHGLIFNIEGDGAIVILRFDGNGCSGTNTFLIKELQELAIALVDATDAVLLPWLCLTQETKAMLASFRFTAQIQPVTMRTEVFVTKLVDKLLFKGRRNCVLQALSLIMDLIPGHAEYFGEHAFNQVMAEDSTFGDAPPISGQLDASILAHPYKTVLDQTLQGGGDGRTSYR